MAIPRPVHLLVCVHGMWGAPEHLESLEDAIRDVHTADSTLDVLMAETNQTVHTYDGIDWGSDRVVEEIHERVKLLELDGSKHVTRFSIVGYSLGGLLARYVIGALHAARFFDTVEPVNFNTIATPNIGILNYPGFWSNFFYTLVPKLLSRTGEQLVAVDRYGATGKPLLEVMNDPDGIFFKALCLFKNVTIYANAINDATIPYVSAAIESYNPFVDRESCGLQVTRNAKYNAIIDSYTIPSTPPPPPPNPKFFSGEYIRVKISTIRIPPSLQYRFPLNILACVLLPVLFPAFVILIAMRLTLESRASRTRVKLLESFPSPSSSSSDLHALFDDIEAAATDVMTEPLSPSSASRKEVKVSSRCSSSEKSEKNKHHPILTPTQLAMIDNLNRIPQLKKRLVYIETAMNAHGIIVARRDTVKGYPELEAVGKDVLRCWADAFEI